MFRTATAPPRTFTASMTAWRDSADNWFDGTIATVDERLRRCAKLLNVANTMAGRGEITHLNAIQELSADRRVLADLREELLTTGPGGGMTGVSSSRRTAAVADDAPTSSQGRRWVELEATRFLRANLDAAHAPAELAERARRHADLHASTLPDPSRVTAAFVRKVAALGASMPRMRTAATPAPSMDFDDTALFI